MEESRVDEGLPLAVVPGTSRRIFVIDDDFVLRAGLAELLTGEGYRVVCAADGIEALSCLEQDANWLAILLDIMLPRLDGIELRRLQMRSSGLRSVPTIAMTAIWNLSELDSCAFHDVFKKPLDIKRLLRTLSVIRAKNN
jgi:CheY-like chemotaxis protein